MRVKDVMTSTPGACQIAGGSANDAARIMWERDCGVVPVVDANGHVVGVVTDRDICMAAYFQGVPLKSIQVADIMTRDVCTCEAEADLAEAERLMQERQVRRLPVVENGGTLVGILSLSDVAQGVKRANGGRQKSADGDELIQTVTAVSEPRTQHSAI